MMLMLALTRDRALAHREIAKGGGEGVWVKKARAVEVHVHFN